MPRPRPRAPSPEIQPTPERLAKGDIRSYLPRMDGNRTPARRHRVQPAPNPLLDFLNRQPTGTPQARAMVQAMYEEGQRFGSAYERATREVGAINLDSMGGGFSPGPTHARCEAMTDLHRMIAKLGDTEHDRLAHARILIHVCGERRSIRDLAAGARARQATANILLTALARLAR